MKFFARKFGGQFAPESGGQFNRFMQPKATKGAFPKILVEDIKNYPIPNISEQQQEALVKLVDKIIIQKQEGKDSIDNEKKIDEIIYSLYCITPAEQKIISGQ